MIRLSSTDFVGIASSEPIQYGKVIHVYGSGDVTVDYTNYDEIVGENVGTGDGTTVTFNLVGHDVTQGSDVVYLDGVTQVRDTDYTIDLVAGSITFTTAPASGQVITADYNGYIDRSITVSASAGDDIKPSNGCKTVTSVGQIGIHSL